MRIGIIGIRGIPNQYGGFEQFTEHVAPELVQRGHEVFVYNSSLHPYDQLLWRGVRIIRKFDPENRIGTAGQFIYDFNCIVDSRKRNFDVILQLGYTSSSIWRFLMPGSPVLITNMDGLEWKRTKYSPVVQQFLKRAEKWAAIKSDILIADSKGIQDYLFTKYNKESFFLPYGADVFKNPDVNRLVKFDLKPYDFNLLIARMEPENNIETIILGHQQAAGKRKLILIGKHQNKFGAYLKNKYENESTLFLGAVYDLELLNNLRFFSHVYFHGHSVGGTNPSLLEAMASNALIIANENIFNRSILEEDAFYFSSASDIKDILSKVGNKNDHSLLLQHNRERIEQYFSWEKIINRLEELFLKSLHEDR